MRRKKRRKLPNGEEFLVDREARWAVRLSIAGGIVCGLVSWSFWWGLAAVWLVWLGIEVMTSLWELVELSRGNDPYADRRAESELIREERLRKERQEEERRRLTLRDRWWRRLVGLLRRRGRQGDGRDERGPSDEP